MNPLDQQFLDLAKSLLQKTSSGKVTWRRTDKAGRYLYVGDKVSVILEGPASTLGYPLTGGYSLNVVDSGGNMIESVETSAGLSAAITAGQLGGSSKTELSHAMLPVLEKLFAEVQGYMSRPNPLLDDLIREIDTK